MSPPTGHDKFLRRRDYEVGEALLGAEQIEFFRRYGHWLAALENGDIEPATPDQEHFVAVMHEGATPVSEIEQGWLRLRARHTTDAVLSYYAVWILVAYFAAGLVWFATVALLASGLIAATGAAVACRRSRLLGPMIVGSAGFLAWLILWVLMFAVLGFKVLPIK